MKITIELEVPIAAIRARGLKDAVTDQQIAEEYERQLSGLVTEYESESLEEYTATALNDE